VAHSYSVDKHGNIYKNGRFVPASSYKYLKNDPAGQKALAAAKSVKSGSASGTGWSSSRGWVGGSSPSSSSTPSSTSTSSRSSSNDAITTYLGPAVRSYVGDLGGEVKWYGKGMPITVSMGGTPYSLEPGKHYVFSGGTSYLTPEGKALLERTQAPDEQQVMFNQLMERLMQPVEMKMPDVDEIYKNILRSKREAIESRKQEAMRTFEEETLPRLRADLAASGFLHSDVRFARERAARDALEKTLQAIQAEAEADALEEALKRAGLEADIAKAMADVTLRQEALALQAQANAAQQAYQQGLLGLQREQFEWGKPFDIAELTGVIPEGLPGAGGLTLAGRQVESDIEAQRLGQLLAAIGLMGKVPQVSGPFADLLNALGLRPGTPTAEMINANLNRALQQSLASMGMPSGSGGEVEVSDRYVEMMQGAFNDIANATSDRELNKTIDEWAARLEKSADALLISEGEARAGIATLKSMKKQAKSSKKSPILNAQHLRNLMFTIRGR